MLNSLDSFSGFDDIVDLRRLNCFDCWFNQCCGVSCVARLFDFNLLGCFLTIVFGFSFSMVLHFLQLWFMSN